MVGEDLLSEEEKQEVFDAFADVTHTFHKDTIVLSKYKASFSRMDTGAKPEPVLYNLDCRISKDPDKSATGETVNDANGSDDRNKIEIRFFSRYLQEQNLLSVGKNIPDIDIDKDYVYWEDVKYRIDHWGNGDTDFMGESAIIILYCIKEDHQPTEGIESGSSS